MVSLILINSFEHDYNENNISLTLDRARQYATATGFIPPIQFYDNNEARIQRAATAISALLPYSQMKKKTEIKHNIETNIINPNIDNPKHLNIFTDGSVDQQNKKAGAAAIFYFSTY